MFRKSERRGRSSARFNRGSRRSRRENFAIMRGGWRL